MTTKTIHVVVFAFALAGLTIGCRTTPAPPAAIDSMSYTGKQVKINSHIFGKLFKVVNVKQAKGSNQLLMVSIALENLQEVSMSFEFQFRWIDAEGAEIAIGVTPWISRVVGPGKTVLVSDTSPSRFAVDYILDVRQLRPSLQFKQPSRKN